MEVVIDDVQESDNLKDHIQVNQDDLPKDKEFMQLNEEF
jgi:hypothetical protein